MKLKMGRNDPCWCGSGEKYKKCHLDRMHEKELPPIALIGQFRKFFKAKECLHPQASSATCRKIISAHTIQRKGALEEVVDETGHCLTFFPNNGKGSSEPHRRGWQEASTFSGFCERHDGMAFAPLETNSFVGAPEQCFLIAYRAQCHELYQKQAADRSYEPMRQLIDRGKPPDAQRVIQETQKWHFAGIRNSLNENRERKARMDHELLNRNFTDWERLFVRFKGPMSIVSTGGPTLNRSPSGRELQVLHDLTRKIEPMYLGVVHEDGGGAVVFTWRPQDKAPAEFISELRSISMDRLPGIIVQLMLAHVENSYFSSLWWNSLSTDQKAHVRQLAQMGNPFYTPWTYMDDLPVPWTITAVTESWPT